MQQVRLSLLFALLIAALAFATSACKSEGGEQAAEGAKEEGAEAAGGEAKGEIEKKLPVPEVGEAAAPAADFVAPGKLTIDQAIAAMGNGAKNRIIMRTKPLSDSGLVELAMSAIPGEAKGAYDTFVQGSGFDPMKQFSGMLVYADGDMGNFEESNPVLVFGVEGGIQKQLFDYIEAQEDEDDDEDDGDKVMTIVLLADFPEDVRAHALALLEKPEEGEEPIEKKELDGAVLVTQSKKTTVKYFFMWDGGFVLGGVPTGGKPAMEAIDAPLKSILGELAAASKAEGAASATAFEGRVEGNGIPVSFAIALDKNLTIDITAKLPEAMKGQAEKFMAGVPEIKKNPDALLGQAPPFAKDLGKLFIEGTQVSMDGDLIIGRSQVDLAALKAAVQPVLDALK